MVAGFSTQINGKPTYFVEKIWKCFAEKNQYDYSELTPYWDKYDITYSIPIQLRNSIYCIHRYRPKLHTIRTDESNRWKAGNTIHFVIGNRTKKRLQFAPAVKCVSTQKIEIRQMIMTASEFCYVTTDFRIMQVNIDDKPLTTYQIRMLAINDGFASAEDFFKYFNKEYFIGKLIHWTELTYKPSAFNDFRMIQNILDSRGYSTSIQRIGKLKKRKYEVIVNGEIKKSYKQRKSAKKLIIDLYEKTKGKQ